jgi:hypothetical protein
VGRITHAVVVIAGNRQLRGYSALGGLFLMIFGGVFVGVPLLILQSASRGGIAGGSLIPLALGVGLFLTGLYTLLKHREVRFDPARRVVESEHSFLGHAKVERKALAAFNQVFLSAERGSKGAVSWNVALRGPGGVLPLAEGMGEHGDAVAAALRAAAATGLPLDEFQEDGDLVRLRPEDVARLAGAVDAGDDERPWWGRPSALALIAANLVPLAGVLWWDWQVLPLMLLFWLENLIVGAYTIARLLLAKGGLLNLPLCIFFIFHFGAFCTGHGIFILGLFGPSGRRFGGELPEIVGEALFEHGLLLAAIALAVSHGVSFVTNYLRPRAYEEANAQKLMFAPYKRVVVLHVVILVGGFFVQGMGQPLAPLVLLLVLKVAIDLAAHLTEHRAPLLREYQALAETAGVATLSQLTPNPAQGTTEAPRGDGKPLSHYLGSWRLAPGDSAPPGWFAGIDLAQNGGKLGVHLISQPDGTGEDTLVAATVRGDVTRVEWIEVRLRGGGRAGNTERILRFTAAGERVDLHEIQQPVGNPRAMQARSFTLVRAA